MWPNKQHSLGWIFVSRMIGILCFLIVVVLANILTFYVANPLYHAGVDFLNLNFWLLMLIGIIIFIGDIFGAFPFPMNLPAPIIKAIGSVFIIAFVLRVFQWVDTATGNNIYHYFWLLSFVIVPVVFIVVLLAGYYEIICDLWAKAKIRDESDTVVHAAANDLPPSSSSVKSWDDVGAELRMMLYDLLHRFREEIRRR
ncbi:hypothetical protein [Methanoregula sp.]|uniref:hypothetical protein n=1 Tax=Methanoregula sp. TaxID=2052170 RepID=UPI002BDA964F|nr:hypothetical protein [Methanoregula sp.]HVP96542.1 hypothetical protein [Methanoregula sp.]